MLCPKLVLLLTQILQNLCAFIRRLLYLLLLTQILQNLCVFTRRLLYVCDTALYEPLYNTFYDVAV